MFHIVQQKNIIRISCLARKAIMLKRSLGLRFNFLKFSLYFQSDSEIPQIYSRTGHQAGFWNICSFIGTRLSVPRGVSGSTAPFPCILPMARSAPVAPALAPVSDAAGGLVLSIPQPCYSSSEQTTLYRCFECLSERKKLLLCQLLSWFASHRKKQ